MDRPPPPDYIAGLALKAGNRGTGKDKADRDARWGGEFADGSTQDRRPLCIEVFPSRGDGYLGYPHRRSSVPTLIRPRIYALEFTSRIPICVVACATDDGGTC